ncbi:MAG: helix-turn-helix transcriptional regulator [Planctomycetota bacterium]
MKCLQRKFGKRVREFRTEKGWSQQELADRAGRHGTCIGGVERGERNPTLAVIASLAKALGVRIADLFPG